MKKYLAILTITATSAFAGDYRHDLLDQLERIEAQQKETNQHFQNIEAQEKRDRSDRYFDAMRRGDYQTALENCN